MKIYTRTGDAGETGLFGGGRVPKDHSRVEAYGTVDELNSHLGFVLASGASASTASKLRPIQDDLFAIGAVLATAPPTERRPSPRLPELPGDRIEAMERWIDETTAQLPPLREFVIPGGTVVAAALHLARTACRRSERAVVALAHAEPVDPVILRYLNRLSDLLFTLARAENVGGGGAEVPWDKDSGTSREGSA